MKSEQVVKELAYGTAVMLIVLFGAAIIVQFLPNPARETGQARVVEGRTNILQWTNNVPVVVGSNIYNRDDLLIKITPKFKLFVTDQSATNEHFVNSWMAIQNGATNWFLAEEFWLETALVTRTITLDLGLGQIEIDRTHLNRTECPLNSETRLIYLTDYTNLVIQLPDGSQLTISKQ